MIRLKMGWNPIRKWISFLPAAFVIYILLHYLIYQPQLRDVNGTAERSPYVGDGKVLNLTNQRNEQESTFHSGSFNVLSNGSDDPDRREMFRHLQNLELNSKVNSEHFPEVDSNHVSNDFGQLYSIDHSNNDHSSQPVQQYYTQNDEPHQSSDTYPSANAGTPKQIMEQILKNLESQSPYTLDQKTDPRTSEVPNSRDISSPISTSVVNPVQQPYTKEIQDSENVGQAYKEDNVQHIEDSHNSQELSPNAVHEANSFHVQDSQNEIKNSNHVAEIKHSAQNIDKEKEANINVVHEVYTHKSDNIPKEEETIIEIRESSSISVSKSAVEKSAQASVSNTIEDKDVAKKDEFEIEMNDKKNEPTKELPTMPEKVEPAPKKKPTAEEIKKAKLAKALAEKKKAAEAAHTNSIQYLAGNPKVEEKYDKGFLYPQEELCPNNGRNLRVMILITSAPDHEHHRNAIRQTWGHFSMRKDISIGFFVGSGLKPQIQTLIEKENDRYGDIIQASFVDVYANLTLKSVSMFEWLCSYCSEARFILKTDDDMYINVPLLLAFIHTKRTEKRAMFGRLAKGWRPVRNKKSKYYIGKDIYSKARYPHFLTGPAYLFTNDIIEDIYAQALNTTFFMLEDVFITGFVGESQNIKRVGDSHFRNEKISLKDTCKLMQSISIHMVKYEEQFDIYKRTLDGKTKCRIKDIFDANGQNYSKPKVLINLFSILIYFISTRLIL